MNKLALFGISFLIVAAIAGFMVLKSDLNSSTDPDAITEDLQQITPPPPPVVLPPPPPPPAVVPPPQTVAPPPPAILPPPPVVLPPPPPPPPQQNIILEVDDYSATPASISVKKGTSVNLIVKVPTTNVYYGGLELKSSVVNTGTIKAGGTKTVTFMANESFTLVPYWPASGVKKDYTIPVTVTN